MSTHSHILCPGVDNDMLGAEAKKKVLRMFTYGLYALTVPDDNVGHGATVNWVTQTSFDPPMLAVSVEKSSRSIDLVRRHGVFAINIYRSDQRELAGQLGKRFANRPDKFRGISWGTGTTGVPLLIDALGHVECSVRDEVDSGDSVVFIAEVVGADVRGSGHPLTMESAGFRHAG